MNCLDQKTISDLIHKTYRKSLWIPFITAIQEYHLIKEQDHILVCISGGKDSLMLALLLKELQKYSDFPFYLDYVMVNGGFQESTLNKVKELSQLLDININFYEYPIFKTLGNKMKDNQKPCFMCARMRRGTLYEAALKYGDNKIALGHHLDDAMETTYLSMMYQGNFMNMLPKAHAVHYDKLELVRPMYLIREKDIISFWKELGLEGIFCHEDCPLKQMTDNKESKRDEAKEMLRLMEDRNPKMAANYVSSLSKVNPYIVLGLTFDYNKNNQTDVSFNELYEKFHPNEE